MIQILFLLTTLSTPSATAADLDWQPVREAEGVKVFSREEPDNPIVGVRGIGRVDAPVAKVASIVTDPSRAHEWVDRLVGGRIVRRISDHEFIEYDHVRTPFPLSDRDFLIHTKIQVSDGSVRVHIASIEDLEVPLHFKYVRGFISRAEFLLEPLDEGRATLVTGEIHCDPKGAIPKWIVNWAQKNWPITTIGNLRRQSTREDIAIQAIYTSLLN